MFITFILCLVTLLASAGIGSFCANLVSRIFQHGFKLSWPAQVILGLLVQMPLANLLALLGPVSSTWAVIAVPGFVLGLKALYAKYTGNRSFKTVDLKHIVIVLTIGLACLMKASAPSFHYDYGAYYLPTIKWAFEYGTVPGLAHLATRLGFNSSWHVLQAVYSWQTFDSLKGLSCFDLNEVLLFAFILFAIEQVRAAYSKIEQVYWAVIVLAVPLAVKEFLAVPAPDLPVMVLYWLAIGVALKLTRVATKVELQYWIGAIWFIAISALTIKLSAISLLLLPVLLTGWFGYKYSLFFDSKIYLVIATTIVVLSLWCWRTTILTGYPFYPLPHLPACVDEWALSANQVATEVANVELFAKLGPGSDALKQPLVSIKNLQLQDWIGFWWSNELRWYGQLIIGLFGLAVTLTFIKFLKGKLFGNREYNIVYLLVLIVVLANAYLWFSKGPALRFGLSFMIPTMALALTTVFRNGVPTNRTYLLKGIVVTMLLWACLDTRGFKVNRMLPPALPEVALATQHLGSGLELVYPRNYFDGQTMTKAVTADQYCELCTQCWFAPLPCAPYQLNDIELRGKTLKEGFRAKSSNEK